MRTLLKNKYCIINGGKTTKYFTLKKEQGKKMLICLYSCFNLKVVSAVIKSNKTLSGLKIIEYKFLYTANTDGTTFFLKNQKSLIEVQRF